MNSAQEWRALLDALRALHRGEARRAALATIVRTRGSTFRRPGTRMLVYDDRRAVCELSGGCPQRDIVLRSIEAVQDGLPRVVGYNADSGLDVLMEMGCGGELDVLIEPLDAPRSTAFADALAACIDQRRRAWLATVFAVDGAVSPVAHLVLDADGLRHDDAGDPALADAVASVVTGEPSSAAVHRLPSRGGIADVLVEPVDPVHALAVIGSNTAALALLPVANMLGWQLTLVDQDPQRLRADTLPPGLATVCASPATVRDALPLDAHSSVLVMTHNVEQDIAYAAALRDAPVAYLGALASRERAERMRDEARLGERLHAPAGLDVGSETPAEIALSVVGEILAVLNRRQGGPLRKASGTIHG